MRTPIMNSKARHPRSAGTGRAKTGRRKTAGRQPLLTRAEMRRAVVELANTLAPADAGDLLAEETALRARVAALNGAAGRIMRAQLDLALMCLRDHLNGVCPQIPFHAISLLTAGVAYLGEKIDLIPDMLPRIGTIDDALVMALAFELAEDGLRRYCTFKGIDPAPVLGTEPPARGQRSLR
jgi:uncharacterized membrane protein YkvA (DUF1232 family)